MEKVNSSGFPTMIDSSRRAHTEGQESSIDALDFRTYLHSLLTSTKARSKSSQKRLRVLISLSPPHFSAHDESLSTPRLGHTTPQSARPLLKLEGMLSNCTSVQQSLQSIWSSACDRACGSLDSLRSSKHYLASEAAKPWKHNVTYVRKRSEQRPMKTMKALSKALARQTERDEEDTLLEEIRALRDKGVELGDTFKPVKEARVCAGSPGDQVPKSMGPLNQFIFKEKTKYLSKHVTQELHKQRVEAAMQSISPSAEVQEKVRLLLKRRALKWGKPSRKSERQTII